MKDIISITDGDYLYHWRRYLLYTIRNYLYESWKASAWVVEGICVSRGRHWQRWKMRGASLWKKKFSRKLLPHYHNGSNPLYLLAFWCGGSNVVGGSKSRFLPKTQQNKAEKFQTKGQNIVIVATATWRKIGRRHNRFPSLGWWCLSPVTPWRLPEQYWQ